MSRRFIHNKIKYRDNTFIILIISLLIITNTVTGLSWDQVDEVDFKEGTPDNVDITTSPGRIKIDRAYELDISSSWTKNGGSVGGHLGETLASAGDVDGNGLEDFLIGEPDYDNGRGQVFLYYSYYDGPSPFPWTSTGIHDLSYYGRGLSSAGDVNGDGYDDVLIGAPNEISGLNNTGAVHLYYGGPSGLGTEPDWKYLGDQANESVGWAVSSAGDTNDDSYDDLLIGAPGYNDHSGMVLVFRGSSDGPSSQPFWSNEGQQVGMNYGFSVEGTGDINKDGYDDFSVGAPFKDNSGRFDVGELTFYMGGFSTIMKHSMTYHGSFNETLLGYTLSSGDYDGDGYMDIAAGAPGNSSSGIWAGAVVILFGDDPQLQRQYGRGSLLANSSFGYALASGDFNGDGYDDLFIGAPGRGFGGTADNGFIQIWKGTSGTPFLWNAFISDVPDRYGKGLAMVDLNNDDFHDLLIGTPHKKIANIDDAGQVILFQAKYRSGGTYTSKVFDSGENGTKWDDIYWEGVLPSTSSVTLEVRVGNTSQIGPDWTDWGIIEGGPGQKDLSLPRTRMLQYRFKLSTTNLYQTPMIDNISVNYTLNTVTDPLPLAPTTDDWITSLPIIFNWTYSDMEGDKQNEYHLQIAQDEEFNILVVDDLTASSDAFHSAIELPEGSLYWRVRTGDFFGTWSNWTDGAQIFIDHSTPSCNISRSKRYLGNEDISISWSSVDNISGVNRTSVYVSIDNDPWALFLDNTTQYSATWENSTPGHQYRFACKVIDKAGNVGSLYEGNDILYPKIFIEAPDGERLPGSAILNSSMSVTVRLEPKMPDDVFILSLSSDFPHSFEPAFLIENNETTLNVTFNSSGTHHIIVNASNNGTLISTATWDIEVVEPQFKLSSQYAILFSNDLATVIAELKVDEVTLDDVVTINALVPTDLEQYLNVTISPTRTGINEEVSILLRTSNTVAMGEYTIVLEASFSTGLTLSKQLGIQLCNVVILTATSEVYLPPGGSKDVSVAINATGYDGDIKLSTKEVPLGASISAMLTPYQLKHEGTALLTIRVGEDGVPGSYSFTISAEAGPQLVEKKMVVNVLEGLLVESLRLTDSTPESGDTIRATLIIHNPSPFEIPNVTVEFLIDNNRVISVTEPIARNGNTQVSAFINLEGYSDGSHLITGRLAKDERFQIKGENKASRKIQIGGADQDPLSAVLPWLIGAISIFILILATAIILTKRRERILCKILNVFVIYIDGRLILLRTRAEWKEGNKKGEEKEINEGEERSEEEDEEPPEEEDEAPQPDTIEEESMDSDIVSSMLIAIQNFVKEGLRKKSGTLNIIKYGDMWILIEKYADLLMATVIEGKEKADLREKMRDVLLSIWDENRQALASWDGTRDQLAEPIGNIVDDLYKLSD